MSLIGADLRRAASREEFAGIVAAAAAKLGPEEWILGGFWDGKGTRLGACRDAAPRLLVEAPAAAAAAALQLQLVHRKTVGR